NPALHGTTIHAAGRPHPLPGGSCGQEHTMTNRRTGLARVGLSAIIAGLLLAIFGLISPASASVADPEPEPYTDNLDCADLGFAVEFKINNQPAAGTYEEGDQGIEVKETDTDKLPDDLFITISNVESPGGRLEFDWSSN